MTKEVYRVLSLKASLLLLASKPLKTLEKGLNNGGSNTDATSRCLAFKTHFKKAPLCKGSSHEVGEGLTIKTRTMNNGGS